MATNDAYLPAEYNTGIVRGDYFSEQFTLSIDGESIDLTSATARIQLRTTSNALIAEYELLTNDFDITGLRIDESVLSWTINNSDTAEFNPGTYKYDLEITLGGKTRTYIKGVFNVERDVTI